MYNVFIDTNVIFEHALRRKHHQESTQLFKLAEKGAITCYASSASFYTLAYFLQKEREGKTILAGYLSFINALPTAQGTLELALASSFKDIEDSFQYYTALTNCNYFVSFNQKDFSKHTLPQLPCMTPGQFLTEFSA